jgi:hypothetical protein
MSGWSGRRVGLAPTGKRRFRRINPSRTTVWRLPRRSRRIGTPVRGLERIGFVTAAAAAAWASAPPQPGLCWHYAPKGGFLGHLSAMTGGN